MVFEALVGDCQLVLTACAYQDMVLASHWTLGEINIIAKIEYVIITTLGE